MRPDKKKVRHHDSRKKAEEAKRKAADKERGKPTCPQSQPTDAHGSRQNLEEGDRPTSTSEFGKRNITSNWTKYEIPSSEDESGGGGNLNSDGEEDPNTGESYADVLAGAGGSASLLRLRAEREWEAEERERDSAAQFASDLFSLDLQRLEAAVSCVPLHQQLDIPEEDLDVSIETRYYAIQMNCSDVIEVTSLDAPIPHWMRPFQVVALCNFVGSLLPSMPIARYLAFPVCRSCIIL